MLLTITTTHVPATDLGYLLHKHPERCQSFAMNFGRSASGRAHVFYPVASDLVCTAALLLDLDAIPSGIKQSPFAQPSALHQRPSSRPYIVSAFMSIALLNVFRTAMTGQCSARPGLASQPLPLTVTMPVLPCRGGEAFLRKLFVPLGYEVSAQALALDKTMPKLGESLYLAVELKQTICLAELLNHLYVLLPAFDDAKHEWLGSEAVERIWQRGQGWVNEHAYGELIAQRYAVRPAREPDPWVARLADDDSYDAAAAEREEKWRAIAAKKPNNLQSQRVSAIAHTLSQANAQTVVDLGCGEGDLLQALMPETLLTTLTGVDVASVALQKAEKRLGIDPSDTLEQPTRVQLMRGSVLYKDDRLKGYNAAVVSEVIEHINPERLPDFEQVVFGHMRPGIVIITTPNAEYNVLYPMPADSLRDPDHRFEWTRQAFRQWAAAVAKQYGYRVVFRGIGDEYPEIGASTQMVTFSIKKKSKNNKGGAR